MPKEKEDFRTNLERISSAFPNQELIPLLEAAGFMGVDKRLLQGDKGFPLRKLGGRYFVTAVGLARWMS